jgi:hypothetical protein
VEFGIALEPTEIAVWSERKGAKKCGTVTALLVTSVTLRRSFGIVMFRTGIHQDDVEQGPESESGMFSFS